MPRGKDKPKERLYGNALIKSLSNEDGIVDRDISFELMMGWYSNEVVPAYRQSNDFGRINTDPTLNRRIK